MSTPRCRTWRIFVGLPINVWYSLGQAVRYAWRGHL